MASRWYGSLGAVLKVWVVSSIEFSFTLAVFTSEEKAEAYAEDLFVKIEERELDKAYSLKELPD